MSINPEFSKFCEALNRRKDKENILKSFEQLKEIKFENFACENKYSILKNDLQKAEKEKQTLYNSLVYYRNKMLTYKNRMKELASIHNDLNKSFCLNCDYSKNLEKLLEEKIKK